MVESSPNLPLLLLAKVFIRRVDGEVFLTGKSHKLLFPEGGLGPDPAGNGVFVDGE